MPFVFRNNTIEPFFGNKDYVYSGYEDISYIPPDADCYLWFYQVPVAFEQDKKQDLINTYIDKLHYVVSNLPKEKTLIVFSLVDLYPVNYALGDFSVRCAIDGYNSACVKLAEENSNIKIIDFSDFTDQYVKKDTIHWRFYFNSQTLLSPMLAEPFKKWFENQLSKITLKRKKCIILDLDNTLWGGVLGEDGIDGIKIGGDYPGKAFLYFQNALKALEHQGIILAVCSKNNEEDVYEAWEKNPFMVLHKDDFAAIRINWNNKADNIAELSKELNIGLDSVVFVDDNPTERELIRQTLPMVAVPTFPAKPYGLPMFFKHLVDNYFSIYSITDEDKKKTAQYKANAQRNREQAKFVDIISFIRSLDIQIKIVPADDFNIPRIAQMTQKTNQFNSTTHRYTDADIRQFVDKGWHIHCISVADKFGDNGITGCIMLDGNRIDSLLLSCRILGKNIEYAFVNSMLNIYRGMGLSTIKADFITTKRNTQVKDFYDKLGFNVVGEEKNIKHYELSLGDKDIEVPDYYHIHIKK